MKNTNHQPLQSQKFQTQPQIETSKEIKPKRTPIKSQTSPKGFKIPLNLAVIERCILTPNIFDKINETEAEFSVEVHLTDTLLKLDSL